MRRTRCAGPAARRDRRRCRTPRPRASSSLAIAFCRVRLASSSERSANCRHTEVFERIARVFRQMLDPVRRLHPAVERGGIGVGAGDQRLEPADPLGPVEREQPVLDAQHRGRVDRLALENAVDQLALLGQAENLGQRPRRRLRFRAARRRAGLSTSMPCAASPPSAFCQLKVPTSIFVPVDVWANAARRRVAERQAGAVGRDPVGVGHADAAGRAVPGEHDVARRIDAAQIRDLAVIGSADVGVELELLGDVGDPAGAEALPREHGHRPRPEQRPHRHFHRAGVGGGHDTEAVVGGQLEQRTGALDRSGEPRLAERAAMRPAERVGVSRSGRPAGRLGARARRKKRTAGRTWGLARAAPARSTHQFNSPSRERAPRWDGVARRRF